MATQLFFALSEQYMQACNIGRQAAFLEVQGNLPGAAQLLANASAQLDNIITTAQQYRMPVLEGVFFTAAYLHYNAARLALMTGWVQNAPMHLYYAECALNQAIQINPNFAPYHASAGMVEIARQNLPDAIRAFTRAVQLNPMDAFSQYMLSVLNVNQGNQVMANQYFQAAAQTVPNLPSPQMMAQQMQPAPPPPSANLSGAGAAQEKKVGFDWSQLMKTVASVADCVAKFAPAGASAAAPSSAFAGFNPAASYLSGQFNMNFRGY